MVAWLSEQGWKEDVFLDIDPSRGLVAGERWEQALLNAANRCEAVLFVISEDWLASRWCLHELHLAHKLNKRLFGVLIEEIEKDRLPLELTESWQFVRLASGEQSSAIVVTTPITNEKTEVRFSPEGLERLREGLSRSGLNPRFFPWPPEDDLERAPYRGLNAYEASDAGIFFGREGAIIDAIEQLRGLRLLPAAKMLTVLGASGSGKSSFLRAGLLPRLSRDDRHFLPLPVVRPERAVISGQQGLARCLERALADANITNVGPITTTPEAVLDILRRVQDAHRARLHDASATPLLLLPIDQAEELFSGASGETRDFLELIGQTLALAPQLLAVATTIRSDAFESLQLTKPLARIHHVTFNLGAVPEGVYGEIIRGPARRYREGGRPLELDERLVDALLEELRAGDAKDALPLLSLALERLFLARGNDNIMSHDEYKAIGGIAGSVVASVETLLTSDIDGAPSGRSARIALLKKGLVPALASVNRETGAPIRRIASWRDIDRATAPMMQALVEARLLTRDVRTSDGEITLEPTHEALLRQWPLLRDWLREERDFLVWRDEAESAATRYDTARQEKDHARARDVLHGARPLGRSRFWWKKSRRQLPKPTRRFIEHTKSRGRILLGLALVVAYPAVLIPLALGLNDLFAIRLADAGIATVTTEYPFGRQFTLSLTAFLHAAIATTLIVKGLLPLPRRPLLGVLLASSVAFLLTLFWWAQIFSSVLLAAI